ncbi:ATP-binding protein, partial [Nonomuraea sp. NPDC049709]|uniref:ATP-binding protein n=1 Tax=Nonomuraea sp. NPDC049709 TaxID=3154736 RepID=UPI003441C76A
MYVGRTEELALLRAELRAAGGGSARRVAVEGPEGIGKTAFIHHALGGEAGVRVLAVSGEESERELRLGVMRELMREAALLGLGAAERPETGGRLEAGGSPATAGGLPVTAAGEPDACVAGQAACDLVAGLPAGEVLAVVVDDAQWADRASLRALSYVLRRVRAGRVLVLVACRDLADPWLPEGLRRLLTGDGTLRIALGGLSAAELAELATGPELGVTLGEAAAARLRRHTLGSPLHARALLAALPPAALDDDSVRLPAPGTYQRPFAGRLHACAPPARRLVAACAVLGGSCPLHVAAAVATGIDEPLNALEEAVAAGLLRELPGRLVDFPEPLARAAAYDGIGAGARARMHLAASRLTDDAGAALRHRAA